MKKESCRNFTTFLQKKTKMDKLENIIKVLAYF